jgi:hypothetical protein
VNRDQGCGERFEKGIAGSDGPELLAEASSLAAPGNRPELDPKGLERASRLSLDVLANADQLLM